MHLTISGENPNTRAHHEQAYTPGGVWDQNQGRRQTRLFAEYFHRHVKVPFSGAFTVLDVGCGLGDAVPVWHEQYPEARLSGCDVAQSAIDRCVESYGTIATFFRASFEEIGGNWDVIFCSNTLEHFEQYVEIAQLLLSHCRILYVMTPYRETRNGQRLTPTPGQFHVVTLDKSSFSALERSGVASIETKVVRAVGAWSPDWKTELRWHARWALGRTKDRPGRQIIYTMKNRVTARPT
ncbi:MAG TPA: class I SAM-dependent methyltransferase [Terriglobia bacterium]|nr:class I SAM-dependent methyltransferase [Terriglobia bacterium]